ncbi:monovalent cation/H(+) antiporter subunit G [Enteractinococcus coprophilus]|uniref:Multicomponent Na+:H+ antiporter subunit G n=1 Tax=Enteractinococcus coprophilus TaxID=1027633 RepID=A0A543AJA6_9MICC|nr:monovalent cation/H(+) antiporter subunit G [Enteractinococcus coprophilus]TQL72606.1 multicomponent Na+:H+ antiporter subunit G [Enteractinococcus coprophilus]
MDTAILDISANVIILVGLLVFAVAAIGLFKFRDVYTRISAVGTAAGLGISLVIVGVFLMAPSWPNFIKLLIIVFLQLATSSIGTMAIARSAYLTGSTMQPGYFDHLAEDQTDRSETAQPDHDVALDHDVSLADEPDDATAAAVDDTVRDVR